jgi:hypothetical protein
VRSSSSIDPNEVLGWWNAAVPVHMRATEPPTRVPQGPDWRRVFEAVGKSAFLCGEGRRVGPATLPWVLANSAEVLRHAPAVPASVQAWAKAPRPPVGARCPGGTCAWCNEPQVFAWDGADWQADPAHQPCRDAAQAWDQKRGMP